jgi:hypothetical protein
MKRLLDELGPSARRDVLASAKGDERFRPEARARALRAGLEALGAAAPGEVENSPHEPTGKTEPGQPSGEGSGGPSAVTNGVGKALLAAVVTLGAVVLVLAVSARGTTTSSKEPPASTAPLREPLVSTSPTPVPPPPLASEVPQPLPASHSSEAPRSTPVGSASAAVPRARPSSDSPATGHDDVLAREVRTIGAARAALAAGDPPLALRELDAYDRIPNARTLRPEAHVLRLEALAKAKREKEARALATTLRADPEMAAYGRRIDAVLDRLSSKEVP